MHVIRMALVCHSYITRMYLYVIRMSRVCAHMSLICTRMSSVCHSHVVLPWTVFSEKNDQGSTRRGSNQEIWARCILKRLIIERVCTNCLLLNFIYLKKKFHRRLGLPDSSETNFDVFPGVLKTCQFIFWSILTGANTVRRNSCDTSFLNSMLYLHFKFDLYSKEFYFDLLFHFVVILEFCFLSKNK